MTQIPTILEKIISEKQKEILILDESELRIKAEQARTPLDFPEALVRNNLAEPVHLIAELKRASPSQGLFLDPDIDLLQVANIYEVNGASAISILTDRNFFNGSIKTMHQLSIRPNRLIPILRKDFIIDPIQVFEARANGADSLLLIVAAIPDQIHLNLLYDLSITLGMTPLVEVHNQSDLEKAIQIPGIRVIGINNRDLNTFVVNIQNSLSLKKMIPQGIITVAESGIQDASDVIPLANAGFDAILVGEKLITSINIAAKTQELSQVNG